MSQRRGQSIPPYVYEGHSANERNRCTAALCMSWKFFTCLLSHITLVTLVVSYCILGAFTFEHLEADNEISVKRSIVYIRGNLTEDIWRATTGIAVLHQENWTMTMEYKLLEFERELLEAMKAKGWDGNEDEKQMQWTFAGALFYSIIVITTIGYGHIAPKTHMGKVTTIFYAILGIPLMLLCLSNIGDIMASSFRFLYWRVCCFVCTREPKRSPSRRLRPGRGTIRQPGRQSIRKTERTISQKSRDSGFEPSLSHAYSDTELRYTTTERASAAHHDYGGNTRHPRFNRDKNRFRDRHTVERERNVARELRDDEFGDLSPRPSRYNTTGVINRDSGHHRSDPRFHGLRGQSLDRKHNRHEAPDAEIPVLCNRYAIDDMDKAPEGGANDRAAHRRRMRARHHQPISGPRSQSVPRPLYANRLELPEMSRHKHFAEDMDDFEEPELRIQAIRKAKKRDRAAPPSPRIMSPMGFAVHRQARYEEGNSLYDDDWDSYGDMPNRSRPVPIWLCVFLVISYIIAGAFLFSSWEPWSFLDSAYFCFITLTTIGFGDYVPATGVKANSEVSIALCSLYLLFGIALLAMSFNLVQEEVIANVKSVARRLGILKEEEIDD
ncbi:uncharacterized protein LOC132264500 [Phlebotomus argentipes]|uniref:uncharacterized protein LOC132264500 n=1 Tax=Phlebotomus argentipes TaxID=94469 RepID=UPI002892ED4D|nr:uncharacterized protein LOC132264500 [Phlebotomus argentipes]